MKITVNMDSTDIQEFLQAYVNEACPSAICKRLAVAIRKSTDTYKNDYHWSRMLLDFANKIEELESAQRKIEDDIVEW